MAQPEQKMNLFPIKAHYFLYYTGTAPVILFLPLYARQLGFSTILVGSIYTVLPLIGMSSKLILGNMADRFQCHKWLLMLCVVVATASFFSLQFIPPTERRIRSELNCDGNGSFVRICSPDTREDRCLISKLKEEHKNSSSFHCTVEFKNNVSFIHEMCSILQNEPPHCKYFSNELLSSGNEESYHSYFKNNFNHQQSLQTMDLKKINMNITLETDTVIKVDDCLLFSIGKIKDGHSRNGTWLYPVCNELHSSETFMVCDSSTLMDTGEMFNEGPSNLSREYWMLLAILVCAWIGSAPISCISDTICYSLLRGDNLKYGKQRWWGSLGWGVMAAVTGFTVDNLSHSQTSKNYSPIFYLALLFLIFDIFIVSRIQKTESKKSSAIFSDVGKLLFDFRVLVFILWIIAIGFFYGLLNQFLFWHIEDLAECKDQSWIKTLQGIFISFVCLFGECPFFFINDAIHKKLGQENIMTLELLMLGIMFLLFTVIENPRWFLPIGSIMGVVYSTYYSLMTSYASHISTPGTKATIQGIFAASYEGIGTTSGNLIAGTLFYYMERKAVFRLYFSIALLLCFLHLCVRFFTGKKKTPVEKSSSTMDIEDCHLKSDSNRSSCYVIHT